MTTRRLSWLYEDTATHLPSNPQLSASSIRAGWRRGMLRYKDFFDVRLATAAPFDLVVRGADLNRDNAWALCRRPNIVLMNTEIDRWMNAGKKWSEKGVEGAATHESGHHLLSWSHLDHLADYYGDSKFSHVMKVGAGSDMMGTFSPAEVQLGLTKGFRLNASPKHPYAVAHLARKKAWAKREAALKERMLSLKGAARAKVRLQIEAGRATLMADEAVCKRIVLLYPFHARMFPWQTKRTVAEARDQADAATVERTYVEVATASAAANVKDEPIVCRF